MPSHAATSSMAPPASCQPGRRSSRQSRSSERCRSWLKPTTLRRQSWLIASQASRSCLTSPSSRRARNGTGSPKGRAPPSPISMRDGATAAVGSNALPAAADQGLGPGVRVGLADDQVSAARIDLATLVAGDDARRDAGGAQQHDEGAGVVLAKAAAGVEQEHVDRVALEQRRRHRVDEGLVAEVRKHRAHVVGVVRMPLAQFAGERDARADSAATGPREGAGSPPSRVPPRRRRSPRGSRAAARPAGSGAAARPRRARSAAGPA